MYPNYLLAQAQMPPNRVPLHNVSPLGAQTNERIKPITCIWVTYKTNNEHVFLMSVSAYGYPCIRLSHDHGDPVIGLVAPWQAPKHSTPHTDGQCRLVEADSYPP